MENIYLDLNLHANSSEDPSIQHSQNEFFIIHFQTLRYSFDLVLHLLSAVSLGDNYYNYLVYPSVTVFFNKPRKTSQNLLLK